MPAKPLIDNWDRAPLNTNEVDLERVNSFTKIGGQKRLLYGAMESIDDNGCDDH